MKSYLERNLISRKIIEEETIKELQKTQTVFFYKSEDTSRLDKLKHALTEAWDITPLVFDSIDNYGKYICNPQYSYFVIEYNTEQGVITPQYYLALRLFKYCTENRAVTADGLCRIELSPDLETRSMAYDKIRQSTIVRTYKGGTILNWSPLLLKAQMQAVCTNLRNNIRPNLYQHFRAGNLTELLSQDTLYVPASVLFQFSIITKTIREKSASFFEDYKWPYRICTDEELYAIFEEEKRGRFIFEYVRSFPDKFITIYDTQDKQVVYRQLVEKSYNLKSKDIKNIK